MDWQAIFENFRRTVADHYFDLSGRVGRSEFWYFVAVDIALAILASILSFAVFLPLGAIYNLAMLLPETGMGARRLQDTGRDGRLVWLFFVLVAVKMVIALLAAIAFAVSGLLGFLLMPGLGLVTVASLVLGAVLVWFWCQPGDPGTNIYGPPPPVFDPSVHVSPSP